ncbi:hypothetical protein R1sor_025827 [Riccia sorocarpa]|uniref:Uncharacterized protein n=1 Tax=Riccia sorocarpa TaxID=122646 RepID=A0ABD3GDM6_9MARC
MVTSINTATIELKFGVVENPRSWINSRLQAMTFNRIVRWCGFETMDCVGVERIVHLDSHWQQLTESSCESSVGNNMGPKQSSKSLHLQKAALRHRMTRTDYELIVDYLEIEENFLAITGGGRKTKVGGRNLTKRIAFGHMAVSLCAQGFPPCDGNVMGKTFNRYLETYKKARTFYTGADMIDMTATCGEADNAADREEDVVFMSDGMNESDAYDPNLQATPLGEEDLDRHLENEYGSPGNTRADVPENFDNSIEGDEVMPSVPASHIGRGKRPSQTTENVVCTGTRNGRLDKQPQPDRKTSLISAYEKSVKEKNCLRKTSQQSKASFRDAVLEEKRLAREAQERYRIIDSLEIVRRARADRRSQLLAEMLKGGKTLDEVKAAFELLECVEQKISGSMM